jgi:uncharacterized protein
MTGTKELYKLLATMSPVLSPNHYVFYTFPQSEDKELLVKPLMMFQEDEGTTGIIKKEDADVNGLSYSSVWSLITLNVHSDLEAVGFLAHITDRLAKAAISVNVVSAYYHDHLFVPVNKARDAVDLLVALEKDSLNDHG